ncbi:hypothetical protein CERSUDRAFT_82163 [Gelatoporia subvermispora B]|uniref:Uncharacterized protein n=1 Tax=Ceriporiopsis subvermispora (strain B) TaxID=914234 RepID=M2QQU0_CERS8|nr:hypothetical protein CERSUDRAFT_82163 [Gelatoporia subvermispora B]
MLLDVLWIGHALSKQGELYLLARPRPVQRRILHLNMNPRCNEDYPEEVTIFHLSISNLNRQLRARYLPLCWTLRTTTNTTPILQFQLSGCECRTIWRTCRFRVVPDYRRYPQIRDARPRLASCLMNDQASLS